MLRIQLAGDPGKLAATESLFPNGPLAVSYRRGAGAKRFDCRYDAIYATPDFEVSNVRYLYDESIAAGSDHAMVVADLRMP